MSAQRTGIAEVTAGEQYRQMSDELVDLHLAHLKHRSRPCADATIGVRRVVLELLHRWLPYGLVLAATEQIEAWESDLRTRGMSDKTIATYDYHARQFYAWVAEGFPVENPMAAMERPRTPRCLPKPVTEDELSMLLDLDEPLLTAVILAAFEGLRREEITKCRREHITEKIVTVPEGKGGKVGTVPTHPFVWEHVRRRADGLLVAQLSGRRYQPNHLSKQFRAVCDALGLPDVHLHRLRHRFGTVIQEAFHDLRLTQECMRHESVNSTMGYTLVTSGRRAEAVTI